MDTLSFDPLNLLVITGSWASNGLIKTENQGKIGVSENYSQFIS